MGWNGLSTVEAMTAPGEGAATRVPLLLLTALKFLANALLRLPYPFIGDVARGLGVSNATVGRSLSVGELAGMAGSLIGRDLDRGRHRRWLTIGFALCGCGGLLIASLRSTPGLIIGFCLVSIGISMVTNSGHSFLGTVTSFSDRARSIGIFETSWALALLVGGLLAGWLIDRFGWWTPFALFGGVLLAASSVLARRMGPVTAGSGAHGFDPEGVFDFSAVAKVVGLSIVVTFGQVLLFSSMGPFLENRHGFTTKMIGAVAVGLGGMELLGSGGTAVLTDRLGKRRAILLGLLVMSAGAALLIGFGSAQRIAAVVAILCFFLGFEFAYVSLLAVVSEVGGPKRGTVVAFDHAAVTVTRAAGAFVGPWAVGETAQRARPLQIGVGVCIAVAIGIAVSMTEQLEHR
jgi:MFS transporter, DHA1 family, inner membrane transport protein